MKLEIARGLFLVGALSVTALAAAAWRQPVLQIVDTHMCPVVSVRHDAHPFAKADSNNLMLLIFGLRHAMKGEQ